MKVRELVELLRSMPQEAEVIVECPYDDGCAREPSGRATHAGSAAPVKGEARRSGP